MTRHTSPLPRRLAPLRRATATAGLTVAALVVGAGGYTVATSPALASAPGDRFALVDLFGGADEAEQLDTAAVRRGDEQASRSLREPLAPGLPSTSAEAQSWVDEVADLEVVLADQAAEEEAARVAAEKAAAEQAAAEKAAAEKAAAEQAAAEQAAAEQAAAEKAAAEQAAAEAAAAEEAERHAAEDEAARAAAAEEAERHAAEEAVAAEEAETAAQQVSADPGSSRAIAQSLLGSFGWGSDQWSCLDSLWQKESNWSHTADNPSSSAYGIPQALPGSKMSSAGSDWESNPETQIRWGLGYIDGRYGSPCSAWDHSVNNNWY